MYKNYLLPASLLAGTMIGAGIFSLPFIFKFSGLSTGFFYLFLISVVYIFVYLMYADIIVRTKEPHRLIGYAKIYLGNWAFWLSILMVVVEAIFVLTIFLVLSESFSNLIIGFGTGLEKILAFWFFGSTAIFLTLKRMAFLEFLITGGIIAIIAVIFILALPNIFNIPATGISPNFGNLIFPLAPVLFSFAGRMAIPSIVDYFKKEPIFTRRAIILGVIIPAIVYGLFVISIITLSPIVTPDAVTGLINYLPPIVLLGIGILGLLSLFSSYILIGFNLRSILLYDLRFPSFLRFLMVVLGPLLVYFLGFQSFIPLLSFAGGIFLTFEGFFIIIMWLRANKIALEPPKVIKKVGAPVILLLFSVFSIALIYEIASLL